MENKKIKKVPVRKCLGCMQSFPKKELIRVVRTPEGEVVLDITGKKSGRGAYVCKNEACLKKAIKSGRMRTNLEVDIPDDTVNELAREIAEE